ncbi:MAG: DUF2066 domain-containing protein [Gammaproteobacteria bacterium]|nr:DUF2066 domain-containing protein [Gammaproteobacteria bacterium]
MTEFDRKVAVCTMRPDIHKRRRGPGASRSVFRAQSERPPMEQPPTQIRARRWLAAAKRLLRAVPRPMPALAVGLVATLTLPIGANAYGAVVPWLYDVEAPVASQGAADRRSASRTALREMLMRLTGLRSVPMSEPVQAALRDPGPYYVQYRFLPRNAEGEMRLGVSFSPKAVRDLVSEAALPIWSANRPVGLAWVAVAVEGTPTVLSAESDHPLAEGLRTRARQRGIEIGLPLLDEEDASRISVADVWYRFPYAIEQATARYEPDVVLVGRARADPLGEWVTEWEFRLDGGQRSFSFETQTPEEGAALAVDEVADELMDRFAVLGREATAFELEVLGVATVRDYATLMRGLGALEFIDRVELLSAGPARTTLRVTTRSSRSRLAELLSVYGLLEAEEDVPLQGSAGFLTLTWTGNG